MIMFILVILLGVDTLLRVFTALKARSAGYKKNGKISYIFTAIILILMHITAIVYYLMNFSTFNLYGSMATVIIMLIWVYTLSVFFMFGGIINVYFNKKEKEKNKPPEVEIE